MHEYGLMRDVVERVLAECRGDGGRIPTLVRIEVGEFAVASRDSLETAFEVLTRGTPLETSALDIVEVPGHAVCPACGFEGSGADLAEELSEPPALVLCPRCGSPLLITAGAGIALVHVQLEDRGRPEERAPAAGGR